MSYAARQAKPYPTAPRSQDTVAEALRSVLADREWELLEAKGPCRNSACGLHREHVGPCGPGTGTALAAIQNAIETLNAPDAVSAIAAILRRSA